MPSGGGNGKALVKAVATAAVPEVAIPLEIAEAALGAVRRKKEPRPLMESSGPPVVAFDSPTFVFQRARIRKVKGVIVAEGPRGLTGGQVAGIMVGASAIYATYKGVKIIEGDLSKIEAPLKALESAGSAAANPLEAAWKAITSLTL